MNLTYLDYQENIFAWAIDGDKPRIYVLEDLANILQAKKYYQRPFLKPASAFLTFRDLKERLFPPPELVLREEKLSLFFYELLTEEEREELRIDDYFDGIELANSFFKLYDELHEYEIKEITGLQPWQKKKFRILQTIRERYLAKMAEVGYTDATLAFNFDHFSEEYLRDYEEILFVNIIDFTPKEKRLLRFLRDRGFKLRFCLQGQAGDFDAEDLRLKSITLPEEPPVEIELYYAEDALLQLVNLISFVEKDTGYQILDADPGCAYHRLLAANQIVSAKERDFTETKIFRYLEALNHLLCQAELQGRKGWVELSALLKAVYLPEFRDYYHLDLSAIERLQALAQENYAYFYLELLTDQDEREKFQVIFDDLSRLDQVKNLRELCGFLEEIDLCLLNDRPFAKNINRYFDALLELKSLEEMGIVSSWAKSFPNQARGLFRLALNYLRYKKVERIQEPRGDRVKMTGLREAPFLNWEKLIIINACQGVLPSESGEGFLLTDGQRGRLGLPTAQERRLQERYCFFRHLFSSKKAVLFSLKNLEKNQTPSPFLEELGLKYGLMIKEAEIKTDRIPGIVKSIFSSSADDLKPLERNNAEDDPLVIEESDFAATPFSLTYYKYQTLTDCAYRFYLEHIARLKPRIQPEKQINLALFGTLAHEIFTATLDRAGPALKVSPKQVEEVIDKKFSLYRPKINSYYIKYYQEVLLAKLRESALHFITTLERKTGRIESLRTEWKPGKKAPLFFRHELAALYLNGRIDLLVEDEEKMWVIDFKTGAGKIDQLDFYLLLLKTEISPEIEVERALYDLLAERYTPGAPGAERALAEKIQMDLNALFSKGEYQRNYRSSCKKECDWIDICRVVKGS